MRRCGGSGLLRGLLGLLGAVVAPLVFAAGAAATPSVAINSFTYDPSDASHEGLILKATNTGANSFDTFVVELDATGTAKNPVLIVGGKSYTAYCTAGGGGKYFAAVQCSPPPGLLAPHNAFTLTFSVTPAYPANQTNVYMIDDKSGASAGNFMGPTGTSSSPPPPKPCPAIAIAPASLPGASSGQPYSQTITGSGGAAPYTFKLASGGLPPGTTLGPNGTVAGTPSTPGTYDFTVGTSDANGCSAARSYAIDVAPAATQSPCACLRITMKLRPMLRKAHLHGREHSFTLRFAWRTTCTGGTGGCDGTIAFSSPQVLAGSKQLPSSRFGLTLKRQTFAFSGRARTSRSGSLQLVTRSRRQLKALFGRTLVYRIVVGHGAIRKVQMVRIRVTRRGVLR